jgi:hypothetical protein
MHGHEIACRDDSRVTFFTRRLLLRPAAAKGSWRDPAQIRDGDIRAVAREASDAMDARGLNSFGQGHGGQNGGEAARQF